MANIVSRGATGGGGGGMFAPAPTGQRYNWKGELESIPQGQMTADPVTGTQEQYPTAGVDPSQLYGAATQLASQKESETAASALEKQRFDQGMTAQDKFMSNIPTITGQLTGGANGQVSYGSGTGPAPNPAMLQQAQEAAFARAKDQTGLIGKSAMTGLHDAMAARGILGSGIEGEETAKVMNQGATQLGDVNRQQLEDQLAGATHAADMQYQGGITQRGQNQQAIQGLLSAMAAAGRVY